MTLVRDVLYRDPSSWSIPNLGVAKVGQPRTDEEWAVLRYELDAFVAEGEYATGLERILRSYLANLDKPSQPAVWISGFYGSGKSHLIRVLESLWTDRVFPDQAGRTASSTCPTTFARISASSRPADSSSGAGSPRQGC